MRISDWSSDVCSSDLEAEAITEAEVREVDGIVEIPGAAAFLARLPAERWAVVTSAPRALAYVRIAAAGLPMPPLVIGAEDRSEDHTSELQSLMRISYAVFCLKKTKIKKVATQQ